MTHYQARTATDNTLARIAQDIACEDAAEIDAVTGMSSFAALRASAFVCGNAKVVFADDKPIAAYGVSKTGTALVSIGVPWFIGTNELRKHSKALLYYSRRSIVQWRKEYVLLVNYVDARHTRSIRWLHWLGFTLYDAEPFGVKGLPFHRFEMKGSMKWA